MDISLPDYFKKRKDHLQEVCKAYALNKPSFINKRRTDQFMINRKYGLIWCNIFKAASSTWLWNFNSLAGYSETELIANRNAPLNLARAKYKRPSVSEVDEARSALPHSITFIIVRHPFSRLISGYRDKILSQKSYYRPLAAKMLRSHPELKDQHPSDWTNQIPTKGLPVPTFAQFVQYIIDQRKKRRPINEHWIPMNDFCTPCLNNFDIIAKVETLEEDTNYIVYKTGVENIIKSQVLNRANGKSTTDVTEYYICQLTNQQFLDLVDLYKYDIELFDYDIHKYANCTNPNKTV
ncbi:hypothetical protein SK128_015279 [Halocaridina rubra]|uniref:Carbohydrate sulfotransferase n=1 Tax=Halocaridina rubra TaxID=373956 RepID=A0AAN9A307_HALRR